MEHTLESAQTPQDGEQPNSQVSGGSGQQASGGAVDLQAGFESLKAEVKGLTKAMSTMQSGKDRGLKEVKDRLGEIEALMKEKGVGVGEALNILEAKEAEDGLRNDIRDVAAFLRSGGSLPAKASGTSQVAQVVAKFGLSETDPDVVSTVAQHEKDPVALAVELAKLSIKQRPSPSPATATPQPGQAQTTPSPEKLLADYSKEIMEAPRGPRGAALRDAVKKKYRDMGLDPDKVVLPV